MTECDFCVNYKSWFEVCRGYSVQRFKMCRGLKCAEVYSVQRFKVCRGLQCAEVYNVQRFTVC